MARQYQITDGAINNVVSNTYIHSHAFYFRSVLSRIGITLNSVNGETQLNSQFKDVETKLKGLINSAKRAEDAFYQRFSQDQKIKITNFIEFQNYIKKNTTQQRALIDKLNLPEVRAALISAARSEFGNWLEKKLTDEEGSIKVNNIVVNIATLENEPKNLVNLIVDGVYSSMLKGSFNTEKEKNLGLEYVQLRSSLSKKRRKEIEKVLTEIASRNSTGSNGQITVIIEIFRQVLDKIQVEGNRLFTDDEINEIVNILKSESINFGFSIYQLGDTSNTIGLIGELNFGILMNNLLPRLKHQGNTLNKNKKQDIKDFLWDGFGIQVKNVNSPNVKIQDSISIDGLIDKIVTGDFNTKMKYLIANMIFFRKMGDMPALNNTSKDEDWGMPIAEQGQLEEFVYLFLNYYSDILFQAEFVNKEEQEFDIKNIFYFYQNKHLIPISNFFEAIYQSVLEIKNNKKREKDVYLGGIRKSIGYTPGGDIMNSTYQEFWKKKVEEKKPTGVIEYPSNLVAVGSNLGKNITSNSKAKVNFFININNIMSNMDIGG